MNAEKNKLGVESSKLNDSDRKNLIKELSGKLNNIKKNNKQLYSDMDKLNKKIVNEYDLEKQLNMLKHTYEKGDFVVVKEYEGMDDGTTQTKYIICEITQLKNVKEYIVRDFTVGMKYCFTRELIHERNILCHVNAVKSISNIEVYDESYKGKIEYQEKKINSSKT